MEPIPAWEKNEIGRFAHHGGNLVAGVLLAALCGNVGWWSAWQEWPDFLTPIFKWTVVAVLFLIAGFMALFALSAAVNLLRTAEEEREAAMDDGLPTHRE